MRILIIGGTSGIGLALAQHYLSLGEQVAVCGRDLQRLDPQLVERYPAMGRYQLDIADKNALAAAIDDFSGGGLDLLIVTAGLYFNTPSIQLDPATALQMLRTNVSGLNHAFELASAKMLPRKSGQLVAIASIAGLLHDYPGASLYSATKRMVIALCETYRKALAPFSIAVTTIVPGYIDTAKLRALNHGDASHKPFLLSEQQALAHITQAIAQRQARCIFPWQMHWLVSLFNCLPPPLRRLIRK
ncbi:SDR family NAD(P)-dependent oxidoreductase [Collimonas pratensis]|uniref:Short chain dehydrogenase family protein n=1 Tax=Collimonas pratensis TaxID=279113 RepID=A0ABM5Z5Z7_9BURK|nr:SDR family NAD(P)-dependent oxidoreductase [Collimonas pratensis]AMP14535.1 short chain dehydrogenase family protein [Collimonas pratensis]